MTNRDLGQKKNAPALLALAMVTIFAMPLNFKYLMDLKKLFGELYFLAYFYVFIVVAAGFLLAVALRKIEKLHMDTVYRNFLFIFSLGLFVSTVTKYRTIQNSYFKGRSGNEKFVLQMITALAILALIFIIYNILVANGIKLGFDRVMGMIYRTMDVMIVFMIVYCVLEYINLHFFTVPVFTQLDQFIHASHDPFKRVRFVSFEVAQLGLFTSIILPFCYLRIHREPGKIRNWIYLAGIFFIIGVSESRSAAANSAILTIVFLFLCVSKMRSAHQKYLTIVAVSTSLIIVMIFSDYFLYSTTFKVMSTLVDDKGTVQAESNASRFGMVTTGLDMIKDNPLGVGIGQYGFNFTKYADFGTLNYEIKQWMNSGVDLWPTSLNFYIRVAAELGIIGLAAFLYLWLSLLKRTMSLFRRSQTGYFDFELCILLIVGCMATGFQIDSWTNPAIWFSIAVSMFVVYAAANKNKKENEYASN